MDTFTLPKSRFATSQQFRDHCKEVSRANPGRWVWAWVGFSKITFYISARQPSTDCPASTQTYKAVGGFYRDGLVKQPGKAWLRRYNHIPVRD